MGQQVKHAGKDTKICRERTGGAKETGQEHTRKIAVAKKNDARVQDTSGQVISTGVQERSSAGMMRETELNAKGNGERWGKHC